MSHEPTFQQLRAARLASPPRSAPSSPTHVGGTTLTTTTTAEAAAAGPGGVTGVGGGAREMDAQVQGPVYTLSPNARAALGAIENKVAGRSAAGSKASAAAPAPATATATATATGGEGPPPQPDWLLRPYLRGVYVVHSDGADSDVTSMMGASPTEQEAALVEETLYALMGIESDHIRAYPSGAGLVFQVAAAADVDPSISDLLARILPLAGAYTTVAKFVESGSRYEAGLVSHALTACIRELLNEYLILLAQLEHQHGARQLNLQKLWFFIQPSLSTLSTLARIAESVVGASATGGALLSLLHDALVVAAGDSPKRALLEHLLRSAATPYFAMLTAWVTTGTVDDPYGEFMVAGAPTPKDDRSGILGDTYWNATYGLVSKGLIPVFLAKLAPTILSTGKYLNVLVGCGEVIDSAALLPPGITTVDYSPNERDYMKVVEHAHGSAAALFLNILRTKYALVPRLQSLKRYFLLEQGDVLPHFLEIAGDELARPIPSIDLPKLEALLELAVRSTSSREDKYKDELGLVLVPVSIASQLAAFNSPGGSTADPPRESLTGFEGLTFKFAVEWPLNLVLNKASLAKYQLLNRHLVKVHRVSAAMSKAWAHHKLTKGADVQALFKRAFALRSKMLHFVSSLSNYMYYQVLEPAWDAMTSSLAAATTLEELTLAHEDFLNRALKECLLTHPELLKLVSKLMSTCSIFGEYTAHLLATLSLDGMSVYINPPVEPSDLDADALDNSISGSLEARRARAASAKATTHSLLDDKYHRTLAKFETNLGHHMRLLGQTLRLMSSSEKHAAALWGALDFNGFYSEALGLYSY